MSGGGALRRRFAANWRLRSPARHFASTAERHADFTHAVIGGGVVGLAVARALAVREGSRATVVLLERHGAVGTETSSRSSEVIHAGLYYGPPASSLKTRLCIRGRELLYALCRERGVPHRRCGKWIVAQTGAQREALERIHAFARDEAGVPTRWVGAGEAARREPAVRALAGVLESPETGIVDSHALMLALLGLFEDSGRGVLALRSAVDAVEPLRRDGVGAPGSGGWRLRIRDAAAAASSSSSSSASASSTASSTATANSTAAAATATAIDSSRDDPSSSSQEEATPTTTITAETLVNAAGLGAADVHNMIATPAGGPRQELFYAKGNYFSYAAAHPRVGTLVYPAPEPGHGGLGTHLTLDLAGRMRFGPDVEWVDSPDDVAVNAARLLDAAREIRRYLPSVDAAALAPDYAGIRPKLARAGAVASGAGFVDFVVRREDGFDGWVNLLGIESPGLTSSLAIGEMVADLLYS